MTGLQVWTQKLNAYRSNRAKNDADWWDNYAQWYNGWIDENDYGRFIYPKIQTHIRENVLEIGVGTGIITRRLVNDAKHVDALEPSLAMRDFLKGNLAHATNLTIIPTKIEDYLDCLRQYKAIVAINAIYNITEIDMVLVKLVAAADYMAVAIGTGQPSALFKTIQERFAGKVKPSPPGQAELSLMLNDLGISHQIDTLDIPTKYTFPNKPAMLDWLLAYFSILPNRKQDLAEFIMPHAQSSDKKVWFVDTRKLALIQIDRFLQ